MTLHPQYKAIISEVRPSDPALPPLERQTWTFFNDPTDELAGAHDPEPPPADEKNPFRHHYVVVERVDDPAAPGGDFRVALLMRPS